MTVDWIMDSALTLFRRATTKNVSNISGFTVDTTRSGPSYSISGSRNNKTNKLSQEEIMNGCRLGLDSHADVSCVGKHARIIEVIEGTSSTVYPFNESYEPMQGIKSVNAAFAMDVHNDQTYILRINQALDFSNSMDHSLLCVNQVWSNGILVDDIPPLFDIKGTSTHSIRLEGEQIELPLLSVGPISYLLVRHPSQHEMDNCHHIHLTSDTNLWEPSEMNVSNSLKHENLGSTTVSDSGMDNFDLRLLCKMVSSFRRDKYRSCSAEHLARLWNISLEDAQLTLNASTQDYLRTQEGAMTRRYKTWAHQRQYCQLGGFLSQFYSDTFKSSIKSLRGNQYIQLFSNRGGFVKSYPIESRKRASDSLNKFMHEVGIPSSLTTDNAKELVEGDWTKLCRKHHVIMKATEPYSPWQNSAELAGGIIKRKVRRIMRTTNTPLVLWDFCWEYCSEVKSLTASKHINLNKRTPYEIVLGYSPDISELVLFRWYQWVWYYDPIDNQRSNLG